MGKLWTAVLPVVQEIYTYGGNYAVPFICRAVLDEIDRLADSGKHATIESKRARMEKFLSTGTWPDDFSNFDNFFETYYESLFHVLALRRGIALEGVRETTNQAPDYRTTDNPVEQFEVKTANIAGGIYAHREFMNQGLDANLTAHAAARREGIGIVARNVSPHGGATNTLDAVEQVIDRLVRNLKVGQFGSHPTFLVTPLIRTALRSHAWELQATYRDESVDADASGHLWTIAAHRLGEPFQYTISNKTTPMTSPLNRNGVLRECRYVRGVVFLHTEWSCLPSCDSPQPFPDKAYGLFGIWSNAWEAPRGVQTIPPALSVFHRLCDQHVDMPRS